MTDADAIALRTPLGEDGGVLGRLTGWDRCERRIRAVGLVGSRARVRDHPADEWVTRCVGRLRSQEIATASRAR
jgi:hypothetical protein